MENIGGLFILGAVIGGVKLLWTVTVAVIMIIISTKVRAYTPKWIPGCLILAALINIHNVAPIILSRFLSVPHYSYIMMISNILNTAGAIVFLAAVYGIASALKSGLSKRS